MRMSKGPSKRKEKTPVGVVNLGGADAQVHQHTCNAASGQFTQMPEAFVPN
jgi:hypothetical protein